MISEKGAAMKFINLSGMTALGLVLAACGGGGSSSSGTTTPPPVNVAPVADAGSQSLLQNTNAVEITLVASDADGDALTYSISTQPSSGTVTLNGNIASYTPNTDFSGSDSFSFTANDGSVNSAAASIDLTVEPTSSFLGQLSLADGVRVPNVTVEALDNTGTLVTTATSDAAGNFTLTAVTAQELVLNFSSPQYANQVLPVTMPDLKSITLPLEVTVTERGAVQTIDINAGGTLDGASGASVTLSSGSFVDADGNAVTGNIDVQITPVDISNPQTLAAFPGDFTGIEELSGTETAIVSLGTVEYIFTQNGAPLQLNTGATAEIDMPLYSAIHPETGNPIVLGDEIALWSLSEDTGVWAQEGTGIVIANIDSPTGLALQATVSHFTWWNIDVAVTTARADVTLVGDTDSGVAVIKANAQTKRGFRTANRTVTAGSTASGLIIPADTTVCFWIEYVDVSGASVQSDQQCIVDAIAGTTNPLTFNIQEEGPLELGDPVLASSYFVDDPLNLVVSSRTLEASVTYAVTSGTLPAGLSLSGSSATSAAIIGTPTTIGDSTVTIEGTDSDGFMDSKTITLSIVDTPPPSLQDVSTLFVAVGDNVSQAIGVNNNGADDPTSWIVTLADGSAAPAGVNISSSGVFTIDSFDGTAAAYIVTAFNSKGASNSVTINVDDAANGPPILPSGFGIFLFDSSGPHTEDLSSLNTGIAATSWTVMDGSSNNPTNGASITNAGVLTVAGNGFFPDREIYNVTAFNGSVPSNVMRVEVTYDDPTLSDPCFFDPSLC